jgi:type VII secretion-associated serine protease mycosin
VTEGSVTGRHAAGRLAAAGAALALVAGWAAPARADEVRDRQWYLKPLKVAEAHRISRGAGVVVGVIDTGVGADHPDLRGAVLAGTNTVRENGRGDADTEGHGTAMAALIAGRGRSGERGLLGIAPAARILPIRPSDDTYFVADGITWAMRHGADVLSMSFAVQDSEELQAAVDAARRADIVLVASAGNTGDRGNAVEYPGAYPGVLAVGAVDRRGRVARFSQHGPQVDIVAPGVDMYTAGLAGTYRLGWGSSNSAAIVAGAAALVRARYPELSAEQVVDRLTATAADRGDPGRDDHYGHGALDLVAALTAPQPVPSSAGPLAAVPVGPAPAAARSAGTGPGGGVPPWVVVGVGAALLVAALGVVVHRFRRGSV